MFALIRTFLRYAGRIGWIDGRHGYPGEEHYQELVLHREPQVAATAEDAAAAERSAARSAPAAHQSAHSGA